MWARVAHATIYTRPTDIFFHKKKKVSADESRPQKPVEKDDDLLNVS
ncbi:MAG: hypothetical protein RLZZ232_3671 [Planctomycetota bacterium]|jgi:hypothetical protein